jgi:hypothetical protein
MRKITGPLFEGVLRDDGAIDLVDGYMSPREEHNACLLSEAFVTLADRTPRAHFVPDDANDDRALCGTILTGSQDPAPADAPRCLRCQTMAGALGDGSQH